MKFLVGDEMIGQGCKCFVVAEIGANHNADLALAKKSIDLAVEAGVDAVKFQLYTAEELVADYDRIIRWGQDGNEKEEKIGEMFDRISLDSKHYKELFDYAKDKGIEVFSSVFSPEGLDFLMENVGLSCIKIAASDVGYIELLEKSARTGLPVMLSLGKCTLAEADIAINTLLDNGCEKLVIMHCVAQYPSPMEDMNLKVITSLKQMYPECIIGFSDHSLGITASIGAAVLGAKVIEKHFTADNELDGPDHWFSMNPQQMGNLVNEIRNIETAMGNSRKIVTKSEVEEKKKATRSLCLKRSLKKGEIVKAEDIKTVRPGYGISPYDKSKIVGLKVNRDLEKNTTLIWDYFKY